MDTWGGCAWPTAKPYVDPPQLDIDQHLCAVVFVPALSNGHYDSGRSNYRSLDAESDQRAAWIFSEHLHCRRV